MSVGGTEEQDFDELDAPAKRERSLISATERKEIEALARQFAKDPEKLLDFAANEALITIVLLSKLKWKLKGRSAVNQAANIIKQQNDLLLKLLEKRGSLKNEQTGEEGPELDAGGPGDGGVRKDVENADPRGGDDTSDAEALLAQAGEFLDGF